MFKKIFITATAIFLLIGCNSDSGGNTSQVEKPSEEIPTLDMTDTIEGIDENQNGIRDDIEDYVNKNYPKEEHRKAMLQFARTMQAKLLVDTTNVIVVKQADIQSSRAQNCIYSQFDAKRGDENSYTAWNKIRSMTTNTKVRLRAYLDFNKALEGTVLSLPEGDTCE
ncbi:MAG: hypothetical protein LBJ88_05285 [Campylobacteraceae bacterium]|jgi:hypothetical protein|nr:hypothetical protein [Campylobacteraceae bacterium]